MLCAYYTYKENENNILIVYLPRAFHPYYNLCSVGFRFHHELDYTLSIIMDVEFLNYEG